MSVGGLIDRERRGVDRIIPLTCACLSLVQPSACTRKSVNSAAP